MLKYQNHIIKNIKYLNISYFATSNSNKQQPKFKSIERLKEKALKQQLKEQELKIHQQQQRDQKEFNIYNLLKDEQPQKDDSNKEIINTTTPPTTSSTSNKPDSNSFKIKTQLMRDFIQDSLYNKDYGYFQTKEVIIPSDIVIPELNQFANYKEYTNYLHYLYKSLEHAWITPVELFKPYYSWSISNYIIEKYKGLSGAGPLKIYEIGAGSGTNALCILNHMRDNHNDIYKDMQYRIIEISKPLAAQQLKRIKNDHPHLNIEINNASILEWNYQTESDECFIILTEVIDNLPHDKITITSNGVFESTVDSTVFETVKGKSNSVLAPKKQVSGFHREESRLLTDPIIKEYLQYEQDISNSQGNPISRAFGKLSKSYSTNFKSFFKGDETRYVPTVCFKLFQIFSTYFPKHHIILSDFDELPSVVSGENAPTVQEKVAITQGDINNPYHLVNSNKRGYESIEHDEILVQPGSCDIFFPYDWNNLYNMYCWTNKDRPYFITHHNDAKILKHCDFIKQYGREYLKNTETKSGFNPILKDYKNMSFLLS